MSGVPVAWFLVLLGALGGIAPAVAEPADGGMVVVGVPGLTWADVDSGAMPATRRLADGAGVASMTVRAVRSRACAVDGWLTLSAGRRAAGPVGPCLPPGPVADGRVTAWDGYVAAADAASYGAVPGLLGERMGAAGRCVEAVGPGAAIGAADAQGRVEHYEASVPETFSCPLVLVDGGILPPDPAARGVALTRVDEIVRRSVDAARGGTVWVAGVGDGASSIRPRALLVIDDAAGGGELTSPSTRQPGLVQLQDLTATLLDDQGVPDSEITGRPVDAVPSDASAADLVADRVGFEVRAGTLRSVSPQVTGWLAAAFAAWCLAVAVLAWRGRRMPSWLRGAGVAVALVPTATFVANLVPWWSAGAPAVAFTVVLAVVVAALTALAVVAERSRPLGALLAASLVTLVVLGGDVLTGSGLQLASVFGQNPTVGGRFYGIGNTSYAVYGVATMAVVGLLATRRSGGLRHTLGLPFLVLLLCAAVEGHPSFGADFGGPPGLLLGGLVVLTAAAGVRVTPVRALLAVAGVGLVTGTVAVLDWLRPPESRTHLGEFVQTVLDGGLDDVIGRKLSQNLTNLTSPPLLTMTLAAVVLGIVLWRVGRPLSTPASVVLRGSAVMAVVGFAVNDSGLVVPAFAAVALVPLLLAEPAPTAESEAPVVRSRP
ncbi:hypothetical protein JQN72_14560 [Phycicoccus sp. CSK15P-2]|uniref:hypothetical protein n=1 Tax=Phycicoccus sp. CSK15P-2 TaxID=2807627 RepID=UPI00194FB7BA|nr:hypothetical protein [Phycicoccus sp. CSK15P-2]MBM6405465.1 hypothetical protein [Phycicoccus sp. CSK15P-2]